MSFIHKTQWLICNKSGELALWRTARQKEKVDRQSATHRYFYLALGHHAQEVVVWSVKDGHSICHPEI